MSKKQPMPFGEPKQAFTKTGLEPKPLKEEKECGCRGNLNANNPKLPCSSCGGRNPSQPSPKIGEKYPPSPFKESTDPNMYFCINCPHADKTGEWSGHQSVPVKPLTRALQSPSQPTPDWEKTIRDNVDYDEAELGCNWSLDDLIDFISQLLSEERK